MAQSAPSSTLSNAGKVSLRGELQDKAKPANIRQTNIIAAKGRIINFCKTIDIKFYLNIFTLYSCMRCDTDKSWPKRNG